jgi:hypothetical protein
LNTFKVMLTEEQYGRAITRCGADADLVVAFKAARKHQQAAADQLAAARGTYGSDEIEIDDDAGISDPADGTGYWVQAWVWIDVLGGEKPA